MNAAEEDFDSKLQKVSTDLIADLDAALVSFIRKPDGHGGTKVRSWARCHNIYPATTQVIDMFQELPQLLDPHLPKWIPFLSTACLDYLQTSRHAKRPDDPSEQLTSMGHAICKILYTFCKVRGEKVIVRFLNVEAKYLEVLLSAVEEAEANEERKWSWEQRYVILLWLSHLLLAPFDLSTISSAEFEENKMDQVPGLTFSQDLPGITKRLIPLAIKYLASPGKERDAAKALLVRMAMRKDMQELGVLSSLVNWALTSLRAVSGEPLKETYFYLGVLSFLAGILRSSSETSDMNPYLTSIFNTVHALTLGDTDLSKFIGSYAVARKMILKVIKSVVVILLRRSNRDMESMEITETTIGYLLDSLSDSDTPVRMSASKSLSVITLKLDPDMASQVVEAVLESLNRNVLWNKAELKLGARPVRDLSAVNHLEWHGLMLTLSHLLYRRSPPASQLSDIVHALLLGLSFDQRSTSGGSVGSNVRDASCFGIWALARRYSTQELLAVPTGSVFAAKLHPSSSSIIQVLATELVMAGCLDPLGNIRRGASAALQELIGRHPDTVAEGIAVVQTVDYHAVARRSRAIGDVCVNAAKLSAQYGEAALDSIIGWRGIGDMEATSRQDCGAAFGALSVVLSKKSTNQFAKSFDLVSSKLEALAKRQVEERHGLYLCLASLLDHFSELPHNDMAESLTDQIILTAANTLKDSRETTYRRPELVAGAASQLAVSTLPLLQFSLQGGVLSHTLEAGHISLSPSRQGGYLELLATVDATVDVKPVVATFVAELSETIPGWLESSEGSTIEPTSLSALLLLILQKEKRTTLLLDWAKTVQYKPTNRSASTGHAYFHALALAQLLAQETAHQGQWDDIVSEALLARWIADHEVETRIGILQSLIRARVLRNKPEAFLGLVEDGLNDYTSNARGDVGSQVRVQALKAVQVLWEDLDQASSQDTWLHKSISQLFYRVLRLATEKLDRVRPEAQTALALVMQER